MRNAHPAPGARYSLTPLGALIVEAMRNLEQQRAERAAAIAALRARGACCAWCGGAIAASDPVHVLAGELLHDGAPARGCAMEWHMWYSGEGQDDEHAARLAREEAP